MILWQYYHVLLNVSVKKEKSKKRGKDLNKKGERMQGSEFDAYTDNTPPPVVVTVSHVSYIS